MAQPQADPWVDFETHRTGIRYNTVDKLKHIITGLNEECTHILQKTGKKQELIDRITRLMSEWRATSNTEQWAKGRAILLQVRDHGTYTRRMPVAGTAAVFVPNGTHSLASGQPIIPKAYPTPNILPGPSGLSRYDPYAAPHRPPQASASSSSNASKTTIRFASSPFFRIEQTVSAVVECAESISAMDRRTQFLNFNLNADQVGKLTSESPKYQLRLFCTSSQFYQPGRAGNQHCLVEFPPTCEVRVNGIQLTANLKGLKKKPGTAPPADLGKAVRPAAMAQNRVEMIYVNSQQPVQHKKYYLVVFLVEVFSVDFVIERLRKGKYKSREDILSTMQKAMSIDDDIIAGPQKMSLKCPLSYVRISIPSRSVKCVHPQCFDAVSWFSMMEQTTTWLCPVCEKVLGVEDMIVDGYFDDILMKTPEVVEDVMVEADGEWHTSDGKFASTGWKAPLADKPKPKPPPMAPQRRPPLTPALVPPPPQPAARANVEVYVLDSDEEDDMPPHLQQQRPLTNGHGSASTSSQASSRPSVPLASRVIDLTIDSDDDEPPPPPPARATSSKRKEREDISPTEIIWKKSRADGPSNGAPRNADMRLPRIETGNLPQMGYHPQGYNYAMNFATMMPNNGNIYLTPTGNMMAANGHVPGQHSPHLNGNAPRPAWS